MTDAISKKRQRIYLWLILALGTGLRLVKLGSQSFWYDEAYSVTLAAKSLGTVVSHFDQTSPLYQMLLHFWLHLGHSDAMVRLLSALFGIGALWVIYLLGKDLLDAKHGLLCAFLLAISPFHIWYSQEARMYSLLILLSATSMLFYLRFLGKQKGWPGFWWVVSTLLALFTHYCVIFILFSQIAYFFIYWKKYRFRRRSLSACLGSIVLMVLPIFFLLLPGRQFIAAASEGLGGNPLKLFSIPYTFFAFSLGFSYGPTLAELHWATHLVTVQPYLPIILPVALLFVALVVLGLRSLWREHGRLAFILLYLLMPIAGAMLTSVLWPQISYNVRYTSAALIPYVLILAQGLLKSRYRLIRWGFMLLLIIVTFVSIRNHYCEARYAKEDYRSAAQFVNTNSGIGDIILVTHPRPFRYYYNGPLTV
ncbi:glycosyltransferase family 39 protein, partial [bacterium]|nr:glycosyltransferase family 39 protein [bacterium]